MRGRSGDGRQTHQGGPDLLGKGWREDGGSREAARRPSWSLIPIQVTPLTYRRNLAKLGATVDAAPTVILSANARIRESPTYRRRKVRQAPLLREWKGLGGD